MQFTPEAILSVERFVEAFVAKLVQQGWKSLSLQDKQTTEGLAAVVEIFDDAIDCFETLGITWKEIVPWVRIANSLRPSAMGGIEGWEHQLKSTQGYLTRFSLTYPGTVELAISKGVATFDLEQLAAGQASLLEAAYQRFCKTDFTRLRAGV